MPGQYQDIETGFHYNYHRYYDPRTGRYLRGDPLHIGTVQISKNNYQTAFPGYLLYHYALLNPQFLNLYGYGNNNPINVIDPYGLLNILLGVGGSLVAPTGVEASGGLVINPGIGEDKIDIGLFGSIGAGGGVNVSGDIFLGYIKGNINDVTGQTLNLNIVVGPVTLSLFVNPSTRNIIGATIGRGPTAIPISVSGTISQTGTFTLRDVLDLLRKIKELNNQFWKEINACE